MKILLKSLTVILLSALALGQNLPNISTQTRGQLPTNRLSAQGVAGMCLETDGLGGVVLQTCSSGGGSGTVTSFSSGTLSPIFTTSVTNSTTTPSLAFILTNATAHSFLGNNTGISGAPSYVSITAADLPGVFPQSASNVLHQWVNSYNATTGLFSSSQPAYTDLSGLPTLAANTTSTLHQFFNAYNSATGAFNKVQPDYSDLTGTPVLASSLASVVHKWLNSYNAVTGVFTQTQPDYSDLTGTPTLPANTPLVSHQFFTAYNSSTGLFSAAQPATSDLSDFPSQATHSGQFLTTNGTILSWGSPAGAGSVTSFSSGNLSPLFTTSVATPTSTPSQTFSLSTAAAHTFFGNNTASTAAPAYEAIGNGDLPGSGAITLNTTSPITGGGSVALGSALTFACASCLTSVTAHNLLSATHGDTTAHVVLRGDLIAGIGAVPTWTAVAKGSTNTYPKWNASGDVIASTNPASGTGSCAANQFETVSNADAAPTCAQPAFTNLSGSVATSQMPALTGDITSTAGTVATILATVATPGTSTKVTFSAKGLVTSGASAVLASADFVNQGTTTTLLHGNAAGNPSFTGVNLINDASANQGTINQLLHGNAAGQPSFSAVASADLNITSTSCTNQYISAISSGGVGTCTTDILASAQHANQGTVNTVLHGNAAGNPAFSAVTSADTTGTFTATAHNLLSATHGDSTTGTVARGDVITGQGVSPTWTRLAKGAAGNCLQMDGTATDVIWGSCAAGGSGITSLNGLTPSVQTFATGTSGTDFNISSVTSTHTFNIPDASATARGLVTTGTQTFAGQKTLTDLLTVDASTIANASINVPSGTAPTTPNAGDIWRDANGFNMIESTTTNGSVDVRSDQAGSVGQSSTVRYTADSNVAKVSENGGALQEVVQLTKTQTIQNKTLDTTDTGIWQFLGTTSSTTSTITVVPTVARKHYYVRLIIAGYSGAGGIARAQFGNSSTPDTGSNYAFGGFNIASGTSSAPTVSGIGSAATAQSGVPVSGSATTGGRFVQLNISNSGARIKYLTIETSGVGASAAVTPNLAHIAGTWNNTTNGIGVIQFQACTTINGACTTVNFTTGTTLTVWGRDDN